MRRLLLAYCLICCVLSLSAQQEKPFIGISCSHAPDYSSTKLTYTESVLKAGGLPILIPVTTNEEALAAILDRLDALILIGGEDVHPSYYGEEPIEQLEEVDSLRDVYDLALIRLASDRQLPVLGICRGEQLINVAFGGSLYQDIPTQHPDTTVQHRQKELSNVTTHTVNVLPGSVVAQITGQTTLFTNTHHHQAVKQIAPGFQVTAWAADGIPEAIESTNGRPIWGVQFHPEALTMAGDSIMERFFYFITAQAICYRDKKQ